MVLVLAEDTQQKLPLLVGVEGGGDDAVGAGGEFETAADFTQIDERR